MHPPPRIADGDVALAVAVNMRDYECSLMKSDVTELDEKCPSLSGIGVRFVGRIYKSIQCPLFVGLRSRLWTLTEAYLFSSTVTPRLHAGHGASLHMICGSLAGTQECICGPNLVHS